MEQPLEVWMRGPIAGIPPLLQPVAHALLQAEEELLTLLIDFPNALLWERPYELASVGFHLQHICGVIDRMFTYAAERALSAEQFDHLQKEGIPNAQLSTSSLLEELQQQIKTAIHLLKQIDQHKLSETRFLGRKKIPTTLIGLLFHAAEHTQRHVGQTLVTAKIILAQGSK